MYALPSYLVSVFILKYYIHTTRDDIVDGAFLLVTTGTTVSIKIDFLIVLRMDLLRKTSGLDLGNSRDGGKHRALPHKGDCHRYRLVISSPVHNPQSSYVGVAESMRNFSKPATSTGKNSARTTLSFGYIEVGVRKASIVRSLPDADDLLGEGVMTIGPSRLTRSPRPLWNEPPCCSGGGRSNSLGTSCSLSVCSRCPRSDSVSETGLSRACPREGKVESILPGRALRAPPITASGLSTRMYPSLKSSASVGVRDGSGVKSWLYRLVKQAQGCRGSLLTGSLLCTW